jgi:hypothetical protein
MNKSREGPNADHHHYSARRAQDLLIQDGLNLNLRVVQVYTINNQKVEGRTGRENQATFNWESEEQEGKTKPHSTGKAGCCFQIRIWCKQCVHMHVNAKMMPAETVPGIREGDEGGKWGGFKYDVLDTL